MHAFFDSQNRYRLLIFNTGAHFGKGANFNVDQNVVESFFDILMERWVAELGGMLEEMDEDGKRRVLVRAGSGGHEDCGNEMAPAREGDKMRSSSYNWARIPVMNAVFKVGLID